MLVQQLLENGADLWPDRVALGSRGGVTARALGVDSDVDSDAVFGVTESFVTSVKEKDPTSPMPTLLSIKFDFLLAAASAEDMTGRVGAEPSQIVANA